ncbi:MAG: hypothetical protein EOO43_19315 [Flavobacterium sp.]|nr:MAG: hypothetical protein EOO43_19315 [Flavobacterium sp.]
MGLEIGKWKYLLNPELFSKVQESIEANYMSFMSYENVGVLKGNITAIEANQNIHKTEMNQWELYTLGTVNRHFVDSDHYNILAEVNLEHIFSIINSTC